MFPGTPITGLQHRTVVELIKKCGTSVILGVGTPQLVEEDEDSEWRKQTEEVGHLCFLYICRFACFYFAYKSLPWADYNDRFINEHE